MKHVMRATRASAGVCALLLFGGASAQQQSVSVSLGLFVYPSNGQSMEQQGKDEQECYAWARQTTGIDPENLPSAQQPAQAAQEDTAAAAGRSAVQGAARGALLANVTDNDWEEGAAAGLVVGARRGAKSSQQRDAQAQQQAAAQQQQAAGQEAQMFKNAFSACMEGRKYTVK